MKPTLILVSTVAALAAIGILTVLKSPAPQVNIPTQEQHASPVRAGSAESTPLVIPQEPVESAWFEDLDTAFAYHDLNGGMLAIIVGTDNCADCVRRLHEAKDKDNTLLRWVYAKDTHPALAKLPKLKREGVYPKFVLMVDHHANYNVEPTTLGLKEKL